jgi:nickel/cobalt transporter (NiCoT) family protein
MFGLAQAFDDRSGPQTTKIVVIFSILIAANLLAWFWAWSLFSDKPTLFGAAVLAYLFGLRHAIDADHIAAIDNVVRKLMNDGKRPLTVGFFFSLGHSTIVILAAIAIALTTVVFRDQLEGFKNTVGLIGVSVSAIFLLLIGLVNLFILRNVWNAFNAVLNGKSFDSLADDHLSGGGFFSRICTPFFKFISKSWHMYGLGFLFGLGFDTATEIGILGISARQAADGLSISSIMIFPALFTAGMALIDTIDSVLMVGAYNWAFVNPIRKLWYNLTITAISVVIALFIGLIEAFGLIGDKLGLDTGVWRVIADLNADLTNFGFVIIGLFLASWTVSVVIFRWKRYGELPATVRTI